MERFKTLRWKLTLSYMGVTVAALLAVEVLFFVTSIIGTSVLLRNGMLAGEFIGDIQAEYTPSLRPLLDNPNPDESEIAWWLIHVGATPRVLRSAQGSPVAVVNADSAFEMVIVGADGTVLGVMREGEIVDPLLPDALADPVRAALAGERDPNRLNVLIEEERLLALVVPVWDESEESVLGVLVVSAPRPAIAEEIRNAAGVLGVSAIIITVLGGIAGLIFGGVTSRKPAKRLENLMAATGAWSKGDFSVSVDDASADELGQLARTLNQMARELDLLLETRGELAVIEERNRLARDLHDSVKQQAFAAAARISAAEVLIGPDPDSAREQMQEAGRITQTLREELTGLIAELRPPALGDEGIGASLRDYAAEWSGQTGIECDLRVQGEREMKLDIEQVVFRVIQEALSNIARHSEAKSAEVVLHYSDNGDGIRCRVSDDGIGFDVEAIASGFGLRSMRERVEAAGGEWSVESKVGKGTQIEFSV